MSRPAGWGAVGGLPGKVMLSRKLKELGRKGMWSRGGRPSSWRQGSPQVPEAGGPLAVAATAQGLRDRGRMSREEKGQEGSQEGSWELDQSYSCLR